MNCNHRSPGGHLTCTRTTIHDQAGNHGHIWIHASSAPDAKAAADQRCDEVER